MDAPGKPFSDIIGLIESCIYWRPEPANVSRDFWMPDQSCRVCYDCDSQFTLFNRRHHCRLCGRIFCAKCTSNWIPVSSIEPRSSPDEWENLRACNFCFKQWKQGFVDSVDNGSQVVCPDLYTSPSSTSFMSIKSSETTASTNVTFVSAPQSTSSYQQNSPHQSAVMDTDVGRQDGAASGRSEEVQYASKMQFAFCNNRSDDDDDSYGTSQLNSKGIHFPQDNGYADQVRFYEIENDYRSLKVHPDEDNTNSVTSFKINHSAETQDLKGTHLSVVKDDEHDLADECEAPNSLFTTAEDVNAEPVDFESNGLLWLPSEPENEDDERDTFLFDEDDDDNTGDWGSLYTSSSFGSGDYRNRDRSNEAHKKAMKNVIDGHFRALIAQLMQVENLLVGEEVDTEGWLEIITSLSWEAATLLKPDMSKGGGMDPAGYVKVKCVGSGRNCESMVIKGVVCKKNVAHRRMASRIEKPRLLILGGALEYQRVSNLLSSFDTLLQQEVDHLKMAVAKIDSHQPDVLLVEKSVSRYAQEYLLARDISLVLNVKRPLLERIARCTGGQIVSSLHHLSSPKLGYCDMFHVERFPQEKGTAGNGGKKLMKTLMYFEGCPRPLGCTILLRGQSADELKKVKHVVLYGVFAAYHLALETSFLADEGASLPEFPPKTPMTVALPGKPSTTVNSITTIPGFAAPTSEKTRPPQVRGEPQRFDSMCTSNLLSAVTNALEQKEEVDPFPCLPQILYSESENLSSSLLDSFSFASGCAILDCNHQVYSFFDGSEDKGTVNSQEFVQAKTLHANNIEDVVSNNFTTDSSHTSGAVSVGLDKNEVCAFVSNEEIQAQSSLKLDGNNTNEESVAPKESFPPPTDHQSILVSLSSRCVWKGTICDRSHLLRIKYYGNFDKPLGRFLRDLFDQSYICLSCAMPSEAHVHCYTHRQGTLTISVKKLPEFCLQGEKEGKIWMWHRCLKCPRENGFPPATRRVVMSDAAWGLSFGKFLEFSFSNHVAASRVASCGHSLHRDCLRFYGFGTMVACFRYASIDVHSVYLPPSKLDFSYENQEWIEKELNEVVGRAELLFSEVLNALRQIVEKRSCTGHGNSCTKSLESRRRVADFEEMLQQEKLEFEESILKIMKVEIKVGQPIDILEINRLRRQLLFQSYMWDNRLVYLANFDNSSLHCNLSGSDAAEHMAKLPSDSVLLYDLKLVGAETKESHDHGQDTVNHDCVAEFQGNDEHIDSVCGIEKKVDFLALDTHDKLDLSETNDVDGVPSDGKIPAVASLADAHSAVCAHEINPGTSMAKDNSFALYKTQTLYSLNTLSVAENSNLTVPEDNQSRAKFTHSPPLATKVNMEDCISWSGMSFLSFYRSLNRNFLGSAQKLDALGEYNPVYVSSFSEPDLQGGARLLLPIGVNDTVIPIYDDEPTSIIAYGLVSSDYAVRLSDEYDRQNNILDTSISFQSFHAFDEMAPESNKSHSFSDEAGLLSLSSLDVDTNSHTKSLHARISFSDDGPLGKVRYAVTCFFAKQFEALRKICCPSEMDFIRSISRCKKWGAQGGKSNVFFAKTLDERFIIKQVTKTELESFIKFASGYFKYLLESIGVGHSTCLAKILGIYQVISKHLEGGKESKMDLLVMENLLFGRNVTRLYDLKGSSRSRYNSDSSGSNTVLLDQNLIESMPTSPIFVSNKAKRLLERAVWNDTAFLASIDVMDYSLLVGIDEEKHELVVGIIDFMRQYTWDKHLETCVKASGIFGGPKNVSPTIISPKQYKKRFRKAMTTYFLMIPDYWSRPDIMASEPQTN